MKNRMGILLAGGTGSRLWPLTIPTCKQLLPVYDKPMVYYPLTTLMMAGIREILVITTPGDIERFRSLLKDGRQWGIDISYAIQEQPHGIAEAFIVGAHFIGDSPAALILGDNIYYGAGLIERLQRTNEREGATIFIYWVNDPRRFGVVELDSEERPVDIVEKPANPRSNWAATGLYFYDNDVVEIARSMTPSARGELEITDVNYVYLRQKRLLVEVLGRGFAWLDVGTHAALLQAANYVAVVEERQNLKIGCPEEIAYRLGYIDADQLNRLAEGIEKSDYGQYLKRVLTMVY